MKFLPVFLVLSVIFISGCTSTSMTTTTIDVMGETTTTLAPTPTTTTDVSVTTTTVAAAPVVVEIRQGSFFPDLVRINVGDSVTWINKDPQVQHWPASDVHPTHTVYPGSDISKCGTDEASEIFDACNGLFTDEEYSFTFNEAGTWKYHDHFNPGLKGTVIVE